MQFGKIVRIAERFAQKKPTLEKRVNESWSEIKGRFYTLLFRFNLFQLFDLIVLAIALSVLIERP